ncbi:TRAP transporter fused permease subunit [Roseococcus sp. SDR]|uniref:TRAP transporter permease n=1 Tax=Roseococcus sp. SDR TaxID=2835532 RepID=UPI001BCDD3EE|nr:TRAP transporter fused permease subunit [Roseococcus sp. SDR]MBS7791216.1 TRAP transporter fused permease subunit [Roseococcus sp. SDR]MBV1846530.1 TRAP transporter fused permease subunit [Roseococcus sp. SDR]
MSQSSLPPEIDPNSMDAATAARVEKLIESEEGVMNRFTGALGVVAVGLALAMSLFHLYAAWSIVPTTTLRFAHVGFTMVLGFFLFPVARRFRDRFLPWDWALVAAGIYVTWYLISGGDDLQDRIIFPEPMDIVVGWMLIALVLEVTRRCTGWIMPVVAIAFLLYAFYGNHLPAPWTHRGYDEERLIPHISITLEGIFGTAVDVSATLIILFTIYGAILGATGAGKYFVDFSFAATGGKPSSAGRTVVLSAFLLGGPSGSGVATTVTIGTVAWPMMKRVGYTPHDAGGLLAAGGLGAIISPPIMGAAAFLIAEYLKISYLDVLLMAVIPTCLFYASLLFMVELDQRRIRAAGGGKDDVPMQVEKVGAMFRRGWYHFTSLIAIIVFMAMGYSATLSVLYAMGLAVALSFLSREHALYPMKLIRTLAAGSEQAIGIAATCACAGIIVGCITLTGLGLKFSDIAIQAAGGSLIITAIYTALIVWVVGLAVPVTASYIICAVVAAPALMKLGVPDYAAHMFVFYYAVLSEVSPPTALSPFAAAAITGAGPYRTTLMAWKYTLPAFVLPFVFVTDPQGVGLLLNMLPGMDWMDVVEQVFFATLGLAALSSACQGYAITAMNAVERWLMALGGLLMVFPAIIEVVVADAIPAPHWVGLAIGAVLLGVQWARRGRLQAAG